MQIEPSSSPGEPTRATNAMQTVLTFVFYAVSFNAPTPLASPNTESPP